MNKKGIVLPLILFVGTLIVGIGIITFFIVSNKKNFDKSPSQITIPTPSYSATTPPVYDSQRPDIPALYQGAVWTTIQEGETVFSTPDNKTVKVDGFIYKSEIVQNYDDFFYYYRKRLIELGWKEIWYASGPNGGELFDFERNGKYFTYGVFIQNSNPPRYQLFLTYSK